MKLFAQHDRIVALGFSSYPTALNYMVKWALIPLAEIGDLIGLTSHAVKNHCNYFGIDTTKDSKGRPIIYHMRNVCQILHIANYFGFYNVQAFALHAYVKRNWSTSNLTEITGRNLACWNHLLHKHGVIRQRGGRVRRDRKQFDKVLQEVKQLKPLTKFQLQLTKREVPYIIETV